MKGSVVGSLGLITVVGISGCKSATDVGLESLTPPTNNPKFSCNATSATMRLPDNLRATLPTFAARSPDDAFVSVAKTVPGGFAGLYFDNDHFVVTFVDPATANQSRSEIIQALIDRNIGGQSLDAPSTEFSGARWTFADLDDWYRYILPKVGGQDSGISSSDIDEKANTLAFGVIDEDARARLESKLASLHVSCNLVTTVIQAYPVPAIAD